MHSTKNKKSGAKIRQSNYPNAQSYLNYFSFEQKRFHKIYSERKNAGKFDTRIHTLNL